MVFLQQIVFDVGVLQSVFCCHPSETTPKDADIWHGPSRNLRLEIEDLRQRFATLGGNLCSTPTKVRPVGAQCFSDLKVKEENCVFRAKKSDFLLLRPGPFSYQFLMVGSCIPMKVCYFCFDVVSWASVIVPVVTRSAFENKHSSKTIDLFIVLLASFARLRERECGRWHARYLSWHCIVSSQQVFEIWLLHPQLRSSLGI